MVHIEGVTFVHDLTDALQLETQNWDDEAKLRLLIQIQKQKWLEEARPEQVMPPDPWSAWYLMGGRGAGKTRAGAEALAILEGENEPGEYAVIAPTMQDAITTCIENTLLPILGKRVVPQPLGWKRTQGELRLRSGSVIYCDGADDGALRMQGKNLRAVWADEVGLWRQWETAWHHSIGFALRFHPAKIIATGTPKMGHGLVRMLVRDEAIPKSKMHTMDNVKNLAPHRVKEFYDRFSGQLLGRQELEGEWIEAIEGDALKRAWWRYFDPRLLRNDRNGRIEIGNGEIKFQWVIVSADTPLKDKESNDNVAIQVWGVDKANRYLLDAENRKMSFDQAKRAIREKAIWARRNWRCQHRVLIENAGMGPDLIVDLKREIGGVEKVKANLLGNKGQRALAASGDLETGNCFLPGRMKSDGTGPDESQCPAFVVSLVDECALFQLDGSHDSHDDQVDAWSQTMNWLRERQTAPARTWSSFKASAGEGRSSPSAVRPAMG